MLRSFILVLRKIAEELYRVENNSCICLNSSFLFDAFKVLKQTEKKPIHLGVASLKLTIICVILASHQTIRRSNSQGTMPKTI